nr:DNA polymerase [Secundilactobacillus kimchicus]
MSLYGQSAMGMAGKEKIPLKDAEEMLDNLMKAYPLLEKAINKAHNDARYKGHVELISGLWRRLGHADSRALRQSFNAVVQGSGAYCTNTAVIMLWEAFQKYQFKSKLVATVHDSVVIDVYPAEIFKIATLCEYIFSHLPLPEIVSVHKGNLDVPEEWDNGDGTFRFPLHGEVEIGANYHDDVEYDPELISKFSNLQVYCQYQYAKLEISEAKGAGILTEEQAKAKEKALDSKLGLLEKVGA